MELDKKLLNIAKVTDLGKWLDKYAKTGLDNYRIMCEWELKEIRKHYGSNVYKKLNHIYKGIREANGRP
jgi:hypothetical protein